SGRARLPLLRREGESRVPVLRRALRPGLSGAAPARRAPSPAALAVRRSARTLIRAASAKWYPRRRYHWRMARKTYPLERLDHKLGLLLARLFGTFFALAGGGALWSVLTLDDFSVGSYWPVLAMASA